MCRTLATGGRRCPNCKGERRRGSDRARYAAKKATLPGQMAFTFDDASDTPNPPSKPVWNPTLVREEAESVRALLEPHDRGTARSETRVPKAVFDANPAKWTEEALGEQVTIVEDAAVIETRIIAVGDAISTRAEEVLDYNPIERLEALNRRVEEQLEEATRNVERLERIRKELDTLKEKESLSPESDPVRAARIQELRDKLTNEPRVDYISLGEPERAETRAIIAEASKAYKQALAEVRELGGHLEARDDSSKRAVAVLEEASQIYPSAWLARSNAAGNLRVKDTSSRAHYSSRSPQRKRVTMTRTQLIGPGEQPPGGRWVKTGETRIRNRYEGSRTIQESVDVYEKVVYDSLIPHEPGSKKPRGHVETYIPLDEAYMNYRFMSQAPEELREHVESNGERGHSNDPEAPPGMVKVWARPRTYMSAKELCAEILVDKSNSDKANGLTPGHAAAVHEMAHRMEHMIPALGTLEAAFIRRRTALPTGGQEPLERIYKSSPKEKGRKDSFANHYMGKEYGHTVTAPEHNGQPPGQSSFYEVISCGMEALFGGQYGGLIGGSGYKPDPDMRNFILGTLASI